MTGTSNGIRSSEEGRQGTMRKVLLALTVVAAAAMSEAAPPTSLQTIAAAETQVSAAAEGIFPSGTSFSGVALQGSTFGIGVVIQPGGSASGQFQTILVGTTLLGQPRSIALQGNVSAGSFNVDGSATFSGTGTLDLGDGSAPTSVPFSATATPGGLLLTIGVTALPLQSLGAGSISIQ